MLTPWNASRMHWYGEEPFPWLGILLGIGLGVILLPFLAWLGFELIDQNLESWTP